MQTTINISLEVAKAERKQYAFEALRGFAQTDKSDKELLDEYLKEKYQI